MKKGFFRFLGALVIAFASVSLHGCASLFEMGAEDDASAYDRGYQASNSDECEGKYCDTETHAEEADDVAVREPASVNGKVRRAIETRDVVLGMTRQDVLSSWGEPSQREVAGRNGSGHERWVYGSRYSLSGSRTIIFEGGKVAGWQR